MSEVEDGCVSSFESGSPWVSKQWGDAHSGCPRCLAAMRLWHGTLLGLSCVARASGVACPIRDRAPEQHAGMDSRGTSTHARLLASIRPARWHPTCRAVGGRGRATNGKPCSRGVPTLLGGDAALAWRAPGAWGSPTPCVPVASPSPSCSSA